MFHQVVKFRWYRDPYIVLSLFGKPGTHMSQLCTCFSLLVAHFMCAESNKTGFDSCIVEAIFSVKGRHAGEQSTKFLAEVETKYGASCKFPRPHLLMARSQRVKNRITYLKIAHGSFVLLLPVVCRDSSYVQVVVNKSVYGFVGIHLNVVKILINWSRRQQKQTVRYFEIYGSGFKGRHGSGNQASF